MYTAGVQIYTIVCFEIRDQNYGIILGPESIPWNRFLGALKFFQFGLCFLGSYPETSRLFKTILNIISLMFVTYSSKTTLLHKI